VTIFPLPIFERDEDLAGQDALAEADVRDWGWQFIAHDDRPTSG
jgi:hypothetical protein